MRTHEGPTILSARPVVFHAEQPGGSPPVSYRIFDVTFPPGDIDKNGVLRRTRPDTATLDNPYHNGDPKTRPWRALARKEGTQPWKLQWVNHPGEQQNLVPIRNTVSYLAWAQSHQVKLVTWLELDWDDAWQYLPETWYDQNTRPGRDTTQYDQDMFDAVNRLFEQAWQDIVLYQPKTGATGPQPHLWFMTGNRDEQDASWDHRPPVVEWRKRNQLICQGTAPPDSTFAGWPVKSGMHWQVWLEHDSGGRLHDHLEPLDGAIHRLCQQPDLNELDTNRDILVAAVELYLEGAATTEWPHDLPKPQTTCSPDCRWHEMVQLARIIYARQHTNT